MISGVLLIVLSVSVLAFQLCRQHRAKAEADSAAVRSGLVGAFSEQRELSEEELELFKAVTADSKTCYMPLSVSTQVVAGMNYRFYCRCDYGDGNGPNHCFLTVYKPLSGDAKIISEERVD